MSLVELLVVMAMIGILAALLLPGLGQVRLRSKTQKARIELGQIVTAITEYDASYSRYPISKDALIAAVGLGEDLTYGGVIEETHVWIAGPGPYLTNNCELMAVLLDLETYGDGAPTINQGHTRNPRRLKFLEPSMPGGTNPVPGVAIDGIYRDPWGSPYLVTLDLNGDGRARDVFYRDPAVSQDPNDPARGLKNLVRTVDANGKTFFEASTPVIAWSAGPDRHINQLEKANQGVNRDNILSWSR